MIELPHSHSINSLFDEWEKWEKPKDVEITESSLRKKGFNPLEEFRVLLTRLKTAKSKLNKSDFLKMEIVYRSFLIILGPDKVLPQSLLINLHNLHLMFVWEEDINAIETVQNIVKEIEEYERKKLPDYRRNKENKPRQANVKNISSSKNAYQPHSQYQHNISDQRHSSPFQSQQEKNGIQNDTRAKSSNQFSNLRSSSSFSSDYQYSESDSPPINNNQTNYQHTKNNNNKKNISEVNKNKPKETAPSTINNKTNTNNKQKPASVEYDDISNEVNRLMSILNKSHNGVYDLSICKQIFELLKTISRKKIQDYKKDTVNSYIQSCNYRPIPLERISLMKESLNWLLSEKI